MRKIKVLPLFLIFVLVAGCVSAPPSYRGPAPDFSSSAAKEDELNNFTFGPRDYFSDIYSVKMGPALDRYSMFSVKPIVAEVSPEALQKINRAEALPVYGLALIGLAAIIGYSNVTARTNQIFFYGLLGASLGVSFYARSLYQEGLDDYNRDLKKKLAPNVTWNKSF